MSKPKYKKWKVSFIYFGKERKNITLFFRIWYKVFASTKENAILRARYKLEKEYGKCDDKDIYLFNCEKLDDDKR